MKTLSEGLIECALYKANATGKTVFINRTVYGNAEDIVRKSVPEGFDFDEFHTVIYIDYSERFYVFELSSADPNFSIELINAEPEGNGICECEYLINGTQKVFIWDDDADRYGIGSIKLDIPPQDYEKEILPIDEFCTFAQNLHLLYDRWDIWDIVFIADCDLTSEDILIDTPDCKAYGHLVDHYLYVTTPSSKFIVREDMSKAFDDLTRLMAVWGLENLDMAQEVIDLSGLCMLHGEYLPKDFDRYTKLQKVILHGCDKGTVANVMIQCAYTFGRLLEFEADFDWKQDEALLLEPGVYGQQLSLPLSWDFEHHNDFCFQVYGDECYWNSFKEVIAEGNDILLVVYSPICCRVGDTFNIAISANQGSWHFFDYATLLLQEVVMQWERVAIVRVKVLHIGTYKDHLKHAVVVPERYAYSPPETGDEPAQACHHDVGEGITVVYASSGGGDVWEEHHIMTIDGIDHLVCIEYKDYGLQAVVFGDLVLGLHSQAPF